MDNVKDPSDSLQASRRVQHALLRSCNPSSIQVKCAGLLKDRPHTVCLPSLFGSEMSNKKPPPSLLLFLLVILLNSEYLSVPLLLHRLPMVTYLTDSASPIQITFSSGEIVINSNVTKLITSWYTHL